MADQFKNMEKFGLFFASESDRFYGSTDFSDFLGDKVFTDGVIDGLIVGATGSGLEIDITPGVGIARGFKSQRDIAVSTFTLATADGTFTRIDSVFLRMDRTPDTRRYRLVVLEGTPSGSPAIPAGISTTEILDIRLADITVTAGLVTLLTGNIDNDVRDFTEFDGSLRNFVLKSTAYIPIIQASGGSGTDTLTITGLNLNSDRGYRIIIKGLTTTTIDSDLTLNNDGGSFYDRSHYRRSVTSFSSFGDNLASNIQMELSGTFDRVLILDIFKNLTNETTLRMNNTGHRTDNNVNLTSDVSGTYNKTDNITRIDLTNIGQFQVTVYRINEEVA